MVFNPRVKPLKFDTPLFQVKNDCDRDELINQIKKGKPDAIKLMCESMCRLATIIALKYARFNPQLADELISCANTTVFKCCLKIYKGEHYDVDLIVNKIHNKCSHELNRFKRQRKLKPLPRNLKSVDDDSKDILEEIYNSIETWRERQIVDLKLQGHTIKEIAKILNISCYFVTNDLKQIAGRLHESG